MRARANSIFALIAGKRHPRGVAKKGIDDDDCFRKKREGSYV